jgi:8-oxo-dGTP diphosphatase
VITPVYLVRHARAGHREDWDGPDLDRPLTKSGWRQAEALVDAFAKQPFARLLSSPYVRCLQTFEPLAESRGLRIESAGGLEEGAGVDATVDLMLAVAADGPAALSTHGDIVQNMLDELQDRRVQLDGPLALQKGSTWILGVSGGDFVAARYLPPP